MRLDGNCGDSAEGTFAGTHPQHAFGPDAQVPYAKRQLADQNMHDLRKAHAMAEKMGKKLGTRQALQ